MVIFWGTKLVGKSVGRAEGLVDGRGVGTAEGPKEGYGEGIEVVGSKDGPDGQNVGDSVGLVG